MQGTRSPQLATALIVVPPLAKGVFISATEREEEATRKFEATLILGRTHLEDASQGLLLLCFSIAVQADCPQSSHLVSYHHRKLALTCLYVSPHRLCFFHLHTLKLSLSPLQQRAWNEPCFVFCIGCQRTDLPSPARLLHVVPAFFSPLLPCLDLYALPTYSCTAFSSFMAWPQRCPFQLHLPRSKQTSPSFLPC
ncbi:hypothetical protein HDV57DRAFT_40087 [Trichoderma longibrachiatum]|uniref:Uncharacterized protein n=1 Tax=Trichoderma longibrachiatum ATCC 18648 TaxID=983965 RepID=A0A2T4CHL9_TRILO|nr:hypothetical protein M440DRAFT_1005273 [Trichoderma longibrachiatum ATCC 18648]